MMSPQVSIDDMSLGPSDEQSPACSPEIMLILSFITFQELPKLLCFCTTYFVKTSAWSWAGFDFVFF